MLKKYKTVFNEEIYLTPDRWNHVVERHPEVKVYGRRLAEVLQLPDLVKISKRNSQIHLYYKFYKNIHKGKYLLVVIHSAKKKLITMFISDIIKVGEVLWQKK